MDTHAEAPTPPSRLVQIDGRLLARLDQLRGLANRTRYINHLLDRAITAEEAQTQR